VARGKSDDDKALKKEEGKGASEISAESGGSSKGDTGGNDGFEALYSNLSAHLGAVDKTAYFAKLSALKAKLDTMSDQDKRNLLFANIFHDVKKDSTARFMDHGENGAVLATQILEDKVVGKGELIINRLAEMLHNDPKMSEQDVLRSLQLLINDPGMDLDTIFNEKIDLPGKRSKITARSPGQQTYIAAIREYDLIFGKVES